MNQDAIALVIGMFAATAIGLYFGVTMGEANVVFSCEQKGEFTLDRKLYLPATIECKKARK